ncbi:DNA topoisomerase (ATP-hydrolyzing) subunit A [[Limnothrix rosea] IAM M-220]|uniref:DNA gyrase/topoisomerase IV subunit A n=1 Tax=[Limnothrix rosea] IAM M-220 TaxID=454133 RepID=UPI00096000F0|nr:DNA topoisomerase (ATP-hydrolyzing) [[Limnothrix rosea] IAM M-220]OKH12725.1 DNA topoisomerase IV [[Limnothrix rosea] IAM M-220]
MAQQLDLLQLGNIVPTALHTEMEQSYLEYAMSVIVGRALPDVRDGLKPVHRRILYAMYELGLSPDRPYRKCARVVGDVLGKYHPHGDQSVYDALVRLVQDFSTRYPLLAGHGNFGSIDNDPPAAMRYTETRLAPVSFEAMLGQVGEETVDFTDNFDGSQQEPVVLPVQLPILLLNGSSGIAVGMATNMPPHNLGEVVDGLIAVIDRPEIEDEKLWKYIPAPDFPTGGEIVDLDGVRQAYKTGRGSIPMRGIVHLEVLQVGKKRKRDINALVITELPYQVNKAAWIEKIAALVNDGKIVGISDIRDESDRQGMRVVIELKRDAAPEAVLKVLYKKTALQSNFGAIMLSLVDNQPRQLSLKQILQEFLRFREETVTRQYRNELEHKESRRHSVAGLLLALNNIDSVIEILRNAPDGTTAKYQFQGELGLSEIQSDAILAMPMRRLTGLEKQKLEQEFEELDGDIGKLNVLLNDRHELLKALKKDLRSLKRKFSDPRRTRLPDTQPEPTKTQMPETTATEAGVSEVPKKKRRRAKKEAEPMLNLLPQRSETSHVAIAADGGIYWGNDDAGIVSEEAIFYKEAIGQQENLIVCTDQGKAYPVAIADLPYQEQRDKPQLAELLPDHAQRDNHQPITQFMLPENLEELDLLLLTAKGKIKRLAATELGSFTSRGLSLIKLKDKDSLQFAFFVQPGEDRVAIAVSSGRVLHLPISQSEIPVQGRTSQGNQALKLRFNEKIVGCESLQQGEEIFLLSEEGYGKRLEANSLRLGRRGDMGNHVMRFESKTDLLLTMFIPDTETQLWLKDSKDQVELMGLDKFPAASKDSSGRRFFKFTKGDRLVTAHLAHESSQ